jgi:hypothetical protein
MVLKKVLAMVLTKYYSLQTLQNPTNFQFFRRGQAAGGGGGRFGSDRGRPHKNALFIEKRSFRSILSISGPSRRQKWIRLEISVLKMVERGLES